MDPKYDDHDGNDQHGSDFLLNAAHLDREINDMSLNALHVDKIIIKALELDTLIVRNTFAWFLHTSIWIRSGVSALIATLYLMIE
jgi:hypothetical protein